MRRYKILTKVLILIIFILSAFFIDSFTKFQKDCNHLRENVLRLHIIANSDSDFDQELKLKVRDRILKESENLFYSEDGSIYAKEKAKNSLETIESIANEVLLENGIKESAKAQFVNMFFNTRVYDNFTLPAGKYDAVRILLGEAQGKNWWCVLYPALCIPAVSKDLDALSAEEIKILESSPRYEVKFFIVEILEKLKRE